MEKELISDQDDYLQIKGCGGPVGARVPQKK